jgi:hypothetical protein
MRVYIFIYIFISPEAVQRALSTRFRKGLRFQFLELFLRASLFFLLLFPKIYVLRSAVSPLPSLACETSNSEMNDPRGVSGRGVGEGLLHFASLTAFILFTAAR